MDKMQRIKYKGIYFILIIVCFLPIIVDIITQKYTVGYIEKTMLETEVADLKYATNIGEILDGDIVEQSFYCNYLTIDQIQIYTQAYGRVNTGNIIIDLIDEEDETIIQEWQIDMKDVPDNDYLTLMLDEPTKLDLLNKNLKIMIKTEGAYQYNAITLLEVMNQYKDGDLYINGTKQKGDIVFSVKGFEKKECFEYVNIWISCLAFICMCFIFNGIMVKVDENN